MTINTTALKDRGLLVLRLGRTYSVALFLLLLLTMYGFLAWRVVSLDQVEPDQTIVSAKLQTAGVPHIDQAALAKIKQLQDNSVEVQTLFNNARSNPFEE